MRTTGCFRLHPISDEDAKFKLCKVRSVQFGQKGIPYLNTYDGRTIRYPRSAHQGQRHHQDRSGDQQDHGLLQV
ncbi:40S ribosomal protein S4 [Zea mays]|uniref:40S ribosomal protein S4 n=1 Tax=Zea mays TaxID=4577 RepID=A0A3L6F2E4_MAIZE|nr:40S ribosomal protein S4 [Zea mays]